jgi:hypothetical protein
MMGNKVQIHFTEMDHGQNCKILEIGLSSFLEAGYFEMGRHMAATLRLLYSPCHQHPSTLFTNMFDKENANGIDTEKVVGNAKVHVWLLMSLSKRWRDWLFEAKALGICKDTRM